MDNNIKHKFNSVSERSASTADDNLLKDATTLVIFKSINNEICNINVDLEDVIQNSVEIILEKLKTTSLAHELKLIYSGKILNFSNTFSSYGIKEDHVILYMLKEKISDRGNEQVINNNLNNINQLSSNDNNLFSLRGFGQLSGFGASLREIQSMRLLFHANYMINRGITNYDDRNLWTRDAVIQREEEWMQQQNNNQEINNTTNNLSTQLRNMLIARRVRIAGESNSVLDVGQDQEIQINNNEKCWMFFIGFIMGMVLGILVLFIVS